MRKNEISEAVRVAFLGNHTVGICALKSIIQEAELVGVVAHPEDPEDGVRYESVYEFATDKGVDVIRAKGKDPETAAFMEKCLPDLLWISDYRYILPDTIINCAPLGAVNLHPSLLPKYRGRAPLNWAIIEGETELGITAHFIDEGVDTGDIIEQRAFNVKEDQDIGDVLEMCYPIYESITVSVLKKIAEGNVEVMEQPKAGKIYQARKPKDGLVNWSDTQANIYNLIRAVAAPYPGAFSMHDNQEHRIWKAAKSEVIPDMDLIDGCIVENSTSGILVKCADGALLLTKVDESLSNLAEGTVLGTE